MAREAFPGYDDPVNIDMDPEDALKTLLADDPKPAQADDEDAPVEDANDA